ncbi:hypothetical protein MZM54_03905 [[Brevibacterium] frigoritolerans]|nr:hypothetical protein [Peribacillus frigoritolerans]
MRKPKVKNRYNLKFNDLTKLKIVDRNQISEPLFWRNNVVNAWCISETTSKNNKDREYGTYNEYWIGIYDEDAKSCRGKIKVNCSAFGGMAHYKFKEFFNTNEMENEIDLEIQEKLLNKINELIDKQILSLSA